MIAWKHTPFLNLQEMQAAATLWPKPLRLLSRRNGAAAPSGTREACQVEHGFAARVHSLDYPLRLRAGSKARIDAAPIAQGGKGGIRKWLTFWSCFFGYAVCYFTRQSLTYTAPVLKDAMGWSGLGQLGQLSTVYPVAYGSSRFIGGVLSDRLSPRQVFALGVTICGSLNVAFGLSSSMPFFTLFWFLNGCFQGLAAPAIVKMIANWFEPAERGKWWAVWHASINVGGFLVPFLSGALAEAYGWRYGMLGPGMIALVTAAVCFALMRDAPEAVVEQGKAEGFESDAAKGAEPEVRVSFREGLLARPEQWALGICYLLCYVARQGLAVWGVFYLLHAAEVSGAKTSAALAAALFSGFELGGFFGNLTAGALSDFLLRRAEPEDSGPGQRVKVMGLYFLGALLLFPLLARCPARTPVLQYLFLFGLGHCLIGVQLLAPLVAAEVAPASLLATSNGLIGFTGYMGAAVAGLPLSLLVQSRGWHGGFFPALMAASALGAVLCLPLTNVQTWQQRQSLR